MSSQSPGSSVETSLWMKWRLAGLVTVGILLILFILYTARGSLLPIILSVIIAELLFPLVSLIERRLPGHASRPQVTRLVSIGIIYLAFFAIIAVVLYLTIQPLVREGQQFIATAPELYEESKITIEGWMAEFESQVPEAVKAQLDEWLQSASGILARAALGVLSRTLSGVTSTISIIIGLVIVPFLMLYMLKDREELINGFFSVLPPNVARHTSNVSTLVHGVVGSYVRAQCISASIIGVFVFLGLLLLDVDFALTLGLLAGALGLIPIIGAFIGAVPGVLVALATDPSKVIPVILVYVVVQFIESNFISPRVQGNAVRLHPIFIMITLIIAGEIAGLIGVIIGVPLLAVSRDIFVYFYKDWSGSGEAESETEDTAEADSQEPESAETASA